MKQGRLVDTATNLQLGKLKADHRRWLASRLNRSKYGDKLYVQHNHTLDIGPALLEAAERLKSLGTGDMIDARVKQLEDADSNTI